MRRAIVARHAYSPETERAFGLILAVARGGAIWRRERQEQAVSPYESSEGRLSSADNCSIFARKHQSIEGESASESIRRAPNDAGRLHHGCPTAESRSIKCFRQTQRWPNERNDSFFFLQQLDRKRADASKMRAQIWSKQIKRSISHSPSWSRLHP